MHNWVAQSWFKTGISLIEGQCECRTSETYSRVIIFISRNLILIKKTIKYKICHYGVLYSLSFTSLVGNTPMNNGAASRLDYL